MTREEALIYLPYKDEDDLQDAYDEKLFELKQFFLSRFPISKVIHARLNKFAKIDDAFHALGGVSDKVDDMPEGTFPQLESIVEAHAWYNREKNRLRLELSAATSYSKVRFVLSELLRVTLHYAKQWKIPVERESNASLSIGKEPDPMSVQDAFNQLPEDEAINSDYISNLPDENVLKSEAKRLSLWLNFELNE